MNRRGNILLRTAAHATIASNNRRRSCISGRRPIHGHSRWITCYAIWHWARPGHWFAWRWCGAGAESVVLLEFPANFTCPRQTVYMAPGVRCMETVVLLLNNWGG